MDGPSGTPSWPPQILCRQMGQSLLGQLKWCGCLLTFGKCEHQSSPIAPLACSNWIDQCHSHWSSCFSPKDVSTDWKHSAEIPQIQNKATPFYCVLLSPRNSFADGRFFTLLVRSVIRGRANSWWALANFQFLRLHHHNNRYVYSNTPKIDFRVEGTSKNLYPQF